MTAVIAGEALVDVVWPAASTRAQPPSREEIDATLVSSPGSV